MAKFTLTHNPAEVSSVMMHVAKGKGPGGYKRLHLVGVPDKDGKPTIHSTDEKVVTGRKPLLYDGPTGVWAVGLDAKGKGSAEIEARVGKTSVARVAVTVLDRLELPPEDTEEGLLVRLFLAETASPETNQTATWTAEDATRSMQWMRLVLKNRLANNPQQFMAKGARTLKDIVTARDGGKVQFQGFSKYPPVDATVKPRIVGAFKIANDDSDKRQEAYARFVQAALDVARSKADVQDPCGADHFLSGWMTVGHSPGDDSVAFQALMTNQFFMLKRKK